LSAINPTFGAFSFRANDKGPSIVDPASARLTIDGQLVMLVASPKVGDATDFPYTPLPPFLPGNHTYSIEVRDTLGRGRPHSAKHIPDICPVLFLLPSTNSWWSQNHGEQKQRFSNHE
jgi:hypothetical protein